VQVGYFVFKLVVYKCKIHDLSFVSSYRTVGPMQLDFVCNKSSRSRRGTMLNQVGKHEIVWGIRGYGLRGVRL